MIILNHTYSLFDLFGFFYIESQTYYDLFFLHLQMIEL